MARPRSDTRYDRGFSQELVERGRRLWTWAQEAVHSFAEQRREFRVLDFFWKRNIGLPVPVWPAIQVEAEVWKDDWNVSHLDWFMLIDLAANSYGLPSFLRPARAHISVARITIRFDSQDHDSLQERIGLAWQEVMRISGWVSPFRFIELYRHEDWARSWNYGVSWRWQREVVRIREELQEVLTRLLPEARLQTREVHVSWM